MEALGGTNMQSGIQSSYKKLSSAKEEDKTIFLMTDGEPNWGDKSEKVAKSIRAEANVKLAVVYIGRKSDEGYSIAKKIAKANTLNDEKPLFYTSESMSELGKIFQKVYADITKAY
jgi:uncharacterized protein with von Willebrand factor type A (vWA) domain